MSLTQPAVSFALTGISNILSKKLQVYFAEGTFAAADVPANPTELEELIDESFKPFGRMAQDAGSIVSSPVIVAIHNESYTSRYTITLTVHSLQVNKVMLDYLEALETNLSFLFVPVDQIDTGDFTTFIALNGMTLNYDTTININGDNATIAFTAVKQANEVSNVLYFDEHLTA